MKAEARLRAATFTTAVIFFESVSWMNNQGLVKTLGSDQFA